MFTTTFLIPLGGSRYTQAIEGAVIVTSRKIEG
jgi:hypothetical protein